MVSTDRGGVYRSNLSRAPTYSFLNDHEIGEELQTTGEAFSRSIDGVSDLMVIPD